MNFDYNHIPELIFQQSKKYEDKSYLIFMDREVSYIQMHSWCCQLAHTLENSASFQFQDKVGIFLPNSIEFVVSFFGTMYAGGTALPYNTLLKSEELEFQINHSDIQILITNAASYKVIKSIRPNLKKLKQIIFTDDAGDLRQADDLLFWDELDSASTNLPKGFAQLKPGHVAGMLYTSGTTGKPKGCMLTHQNYLYDLKLVVPRIELGEEDTNLCIMPLFHVNGQVASLLTTMITGGRLVLEEMFKPRTLIETLKKYKCSSFSAVPAMYNFLNEMAEYKNGADLSFLKACICGAAPMPVEVFQKFETKFQGKIIEGYGLSEGTCVSSLNPLHGERKIGSIGTALEGQLMCIMDDKGNAMAEGEIGEICIKGDNVMLGYYKDPGATSAAIVDGWLHTGDMGYVDRDGYYFITGRKKEMIIRGGENIYPKEIEEALYEHENINECAVIGLPDPKYGEQVVAVIRLKEGRNETAKTMKQYLRPKIANYKMPNKFEFVLELPKTSTGKIQKVKLKNEMIGDQKLVKRMKESLRIPYKWAYGKSMSRFFSELKDNKKIYGKQCPKCKMVSCPPKSYCGDCFVETGDFIELPDTGVLASFTTVHMVFPGQPTEPPYVIAWVKPDGADSNLFHILNVQSEEGLYVGKKVRAVWRSDEERKGSIYDILYYEPIDGVIS